MNNIDTTKIKTASARLEEVRANCLFELSKKRQSIIDAGVTVDNIQLQSDDKSNSNMSGYISESIINGLIDVTWKCRSGARHLYTVQELKPVFKAITNFRRACFMAEDVLATEIENSDDPKSIDINAGWPDNVLTTV